MTALRWPRRSGNAGASRRDTRVLAGVLSLTMVLVAALAFQAWRALRTHRTVAEGVLRDYASFAAWNYAYRVRSLAMLGVTPVLGLVDASRVATWPGALSRMRSASDSVRRCECAPYLKPTYYFRIELQGTRRFIERADTTSEASINSRLDIVRAHALERAGRGILVGDPRGPPFAVVAKTDHTPWAVFYTIRGRDSTHAGVVDGFESRMDFLMSDVLKYAYDDTPFFPRTLIGKLPNDSVVSLTVLNGSGTPLYRTLSQFSGGFTGRRDVFLDGASDSAFIGVMVMNPAASGRLIIGGIPKLPAITLIGLLTATLVLISVAFALTWRASELARQRTDFTSSVSHELRTPLTQILLYGEMLGLRRTRSDHERHEAAQVIIREARRLIHLVENVLHFSRADRRIVRVAPRGQRIEPLLRDIVKAFAPLVVSKGTHIDVDAPPSLVARVDADAFRHVMLNLLDNAARYGPAVQTIAVSAARADDWVTVWVDDDGPGVPIDDRTRIWHPFVRLTRDMTDATTGSGIGLAVVAELVTLMDGTYGVETAPGGGARFFIRLRGARVATPVLTARTTRDPLNREADRG